MMTAEQRFIFDVNGYLVIEKLLPPAQVAQMVADMDAHGIKDPSNNPMESRFQGFLDWGPHWAGLIDHPTLLPVLADLLGPKYRLDHAYGMAMRASGKAGGFGLHHEAGMFHHGCYYTTHGDTMHNGLIVVSIALAEIVPNGGGFVCIPGSHKAAFKMPPQWYQLDANPLVKQVAQQPGDVLIFTEALTHGTAPWTNPTNERRSVLLKYCPHYMQWAKAPMACNRDALSERQRLILDGAYVWNRPEIK